VGLWAKGPQKLLLFYNLGLGQAGRLVASCLTLFVPEEVKKLNLKETRNEY